MAQFTNVVNRYTGKSYKSKYSVSLIGGPELMRKLRQLDDTMRVKVAKEAVAAMGAPIEEEWVGRLPLGPEPIHMRDAVKTRTSKTKAGASGSVGVRKVRGVPDNQQPPAYARVLEYGSRSRPARPAARPAFDQRKRQAIAEGTKVLRNALRSVR